MRTSSRIRPLLVRPGARFTCAGDGLCCTDVHLLGPVSRSEARELRKLHPGCTARQHGMLALRAHETGACTFLTSHHRCAIHAESFKPRTCDRYPFLLIATPDGGRIGTDHRCPCRTMGERALLDPSKIERSLSDSAGRLAADHRVEDEVPIVTGHSCSWQEWRALEERLLGRLEAGERAEHVLDAECFPPLTDRTWLDVAFELDAETSGARWACASRWMGQAIAALHGSPCPTPAPRPWAPVFDRAESRAPRQHPERILSDWVADVIWTLEWTRRGDFGRARADLATRVSAARWIHARLEDAGHRPDRAMAEAISIVEIVGLAETWESIVMRMMA